MEQKDTDVYMMTEYKKSKKARLVLAMCIKKVLVSSVMLASLVGTVAPTTVFASNENLGTTVNAVYEASVDMKIYELKSTLTSLVALTKSGDITPELLVKFEKQLKEIPAYLLKGEGTEIYDMLDDIDEVVKNLDLSTVNSETVKGIKEVVELIKVIRDNKIIDASDNLKMVQASSPKSFKDVSKKSSRYTYINYLANKGVLGGYKDGKFHGTWKVSNIKYICMLVRALDKNAPKATKGNDYSKETYEYAISMGYIGKYEIASKYLNSSITKKNMAEWTLRAMKINGIDTEYNSFIKNTIGDLGTKLTSDEKEGIYTLVGKGIITVDSKHNIYPYNGITRNTAAIILTRVVNAKYRKTVDTANLPRTPIINAKAQVLRWDDPDRPLPQAGDTFIDKNGKKTVLTSTWMNGFEVIGYGQDVIDLYGNMHGLKDGKHGGVFYNADGSENDKYLGNPYRVDKKTGIGYFRDDWGQIAQYERDLGAKIKNPKDGQKVGKIGTTYLAEYGIWHFDNGLHQ